MFEFELELPVEPPDPALEELEELDFADLTADLKRNLGHTLDDIENWRAEHDEMLRLPGQL